MELDGQRTLHVSGVVALPPRTAAAAFDALVPGAAPADFAIRRAYRRLAISRRIRVAVEVELMLWSRQSCEVGLRPLGRVVPIAGGWRHRHYLEAAGLETSRLADAMIATVDDWLAVAWAEATHPSRSAA